jgi:hypothetical protein
MIAGYGQSDKVIMAALDRHDERRRRDVPTITVLVGPVALSLRLVSRGAETRNWPVVSVRLDEADPETVVVSWVNELANKHDLGAAAVQRMAQRMGRDAGALKRSLRLMMSHELGVFLESCLPLESRTSVELVSRHLIECTSPGTRPGGSGVASDLDLQLEGLGRAARINRDREREEFVRDEQALVIILDCPCIRRRRSEGRRSRIGQFDADDPGSRSTQ